MLLMYSIYPTFQSYLPKSEMEVKDEKENNLKRGNINIILLIWRYHYMLDQEVNDHLIECNIN